MVLSRTKLALGLGVSGVLTAVFGTILVFVGPIVIDQQIVKNVQIDPSNSMSYTMWKDIPVPFFMSVYFFHILNPEEILRGEKPMVEQRGPYVYREYRQKHNITFHDNKTVSYREYRQYHFWRNMSVGNESDVVTVPNMLVLGAAVMMEDMPYFVRIMVSTTFKAFKEGPFLTKTVGELMWGYESKLVDFLKQYFPNMMPVEGKFGLFAEFNNSNTGLFTVFTGVDDIRKVHKVDSWNGLKEVNYWNSRQCNMINGTAGQMWPPFMTKETTLPFYSPDACRSMDLEYQRPGEVAGIPIFRYVAPKTLFANGTDYPPNEGFCPCRQSGIMNVSTCRHDSPSFLSHPHFLNGDPVLREFVLGLSPSEEEHGLFIDIHPETGVPVNVSIKLQLNLFIKSVSGITETGKISPVVIPMLWFAESGFIEGSVLTTFYNNLVLLPAIMEYLQYIFIALGLALIAVSIGLALSEQDNQVNSSVNSSSHNEMQSEKFIGTNKSSKVIQEAHF
ncbi:scavenger receptor class B member 1 isoform X2 [Lepisosteus oculatus]|uniref:Scavenger receptor class B member 1 n=1 Tax=Lepisosteus oculatus TaxID=7918 RepID=W5M0W2_LEPOC|nr:PREDICTED: scavenger receptor class B member 1 isoform X2 [Lepisosteus oculatus]